MKYIFYVAITLLFSGIAAKAQTPLSIEQAIALGIQRNLPLQSARNNAETARINNDWGAAGRYPDVNATVNLNNGYNNNQNPASFLQSLSALNTGITPGVEAVWVVYGGHRVHISKEQLQLIENQAHGNVRQAVEATIEDVILSYYQAVIQQEQLQVRAEVLRLSRERLEYQRTRQEFGQSSTFDVIQTQDAWLNDSTAYLVQQTNVANAMRNLRRAIGEDNPETAYALTDRLPVETTRYDAEELRTRMLNSNQALAQLRIGRELAAVQTRFQESFNKPTLSLRSGASYTLSRNIFANGLFANGEQRDLGGIQNTNFNLFVNLSAAYNLFDGGARRRNVQTARIAELNTQLGMDDLRRNLLTQLDIALESYNNQKRVLELSNQLVDNARRNIQIAEERFRGGLISFFDYRSIQISYINATQTRLNALYNLKTTETELLRLSGGLVR
ncbi:MAG: TolC family protein [Saprospiraceae bacterium]|nr:TolC family protein [Saprospiraceae bacterium]